jgi:transcription initiation factor TFIIIB Brf1 subunit/transcription initiation factor TFIIB
LVVKTDVAVKAEHGARWRRLAKFHREALHGFEWRLSAIGGELRRVGECAERRVVEEAESLVRRHFDVVGSIPPEAAAVSVLWAAARAAGEPRPLEDLLKCSRADRGRVRKAAWQLTKAVGLGRRPSIEDYVKTLAARANLPASMAKAAVEILEKNRRVLAGKNPWVWAVAALWLASFRGPGLLSRLAEAAGTTPASIRGAAKRLKV